MSGVYFNATHKLSPNPSKEEVDAAIDTLKARAAWHQFLVTRLTADRAILSHQMAQFRHANYPLKAMQASRAKPLIENIYFLVTGSTLAKTIHVNQCILDHLNDKWVKMTESFSQAMSQAIEANSAAKDLKCRRDLAWPPNNES